MPLIEYTIDGKIDRVKQAVQRIRNFDPSDRWAGNVVVKGAYNERFNQ